MKYLGSLIVTVFVLSSTIDAGTAQITTEKEYTNSIGMKFVRIEPGTFKMGAGSTPLPPELTSEGGTQAEGDFDESPLHTVRISKPFYMGVYEVTNFQYELFRPEHKKLGGKVAGPSRDDDAVINVNWYDAQAFCQWLSDKENLPYRLPTEAEWEYACRAGTTTHYHTGDILPEEFSKASRFVRVGQTPPNAWGVYDMHGNIEEWCYDWYGPYEAHEQVDPIGRVTGDFRVTRGGSHSTSLYYLRSANRLGTLPEDKHGLIGFRVVIADSPLTQPLPRPRPELYQTNVKQEIPAEAGQADAAKPYFQGPLKFVHMPAGNRGPLYSKHNHFTSVTECPNGDLLAIWHTCIGESGRELAVAASRLRYGQEHWEPASLFWDAPDRNDHGHTLWFDGKDKIYHFQGLADQVRNVALVMRASSDNGVTWSQPRIIADHGPSRMPVESVFRTKEGFYAISCDKGPNILLISRDQGISWTHPGGTIRGKHAAAVQLADGRLMALGRERNIDGKMPMSISDDMGKTWKYSPSQFQPVSWGQRAVLLRLKQGPLLFASFCKKMMVNNESGSQHQVSGLFGTVSFDNGKTWPHKRLVTDDRPGRDIETLNGDPITMSPYNSESVGYLAVCQTADKVIHLLTSRQHYSFNLKWLTTPPPTAPPKPSPPKAGPLPTKDRLAKVYGFGDVSGANRWTWVSEDFTQERAYQLSSRPPMRITAGDGAGFYERNEDPAGFAAVEQKNGFTVELKTQLIKHLPDAKGIDIELYDGAGSRYALAVTDTGVYWYEGYIQGSAFLPLAQFVPIAEGLDNTDAMHTYRIAVRTDRVAQIYRDGQFIAVKKCEYRTPRGAYIQLGLGASAEALVSYFAYDLNGPWEGSHFANSCKMGPEPINSIGIKLIRIEPGSFLMGQEEGGNWDEQPVHKVTITRPFYISETEVTVEQFRRFRSDFAGTKQSAPYAAGLNWYEAKAFCDWLSKKEGKSYRLPTEAEWEYACRAGTDTAFWSGDRSPEPGTANPWGLKNVHTGVREWCLDWHGKYPSSVVADPLGPERGFFKIVRGGALDETKDQAKYARSSSRAAIGPAFGPYSGSPNEFGLHDIGLRVVQAPMPRSKPLAYEPSFVEQGVKQNQEIARWGPDPDKPYFRKRYMLPTPPENCDRRTIDAAGLHPAFRGHNHSPGFEVCPNGDLLLAIHTSYHEYEPEVAVMAARLRCGAEQWDMPDIIFDVPGVADPAPMLWNDNGTLYFFCGNAKLKSAFPFHWTTSTDNGATWSKFKYPNFRNRVGPHSRQPINTALRDKNGTMYVSSDGKGGTSVLWATSDDGKTWYDTIGRSGGRHTTYVMLKDGSILGMGGKNTDINGFMPQSVSRDGAKTWEVTRTVFPALGSNQRPSVLRLKSGRLLFAGDFQHIRGHQPEGVTERGSYVALSDDEAGTWKLKKLIGTQQHENQKAHNGAPTIGYSVARQAPNGLIHLITTMNRPCLHFAFNEAWILMEMSEYDRMSDEQLMAPRAAVARDVRTYEEKYPNGHVRIRYGGCIADDGRFLLNGAETWYYETGSRQRQAAYHLGRKVGKETFWAADGSKKSQWEHRKDGTSAWTQWWRGPLLNGQKKAESTWRNFKCEGVATCWDPSGKVKGEKKFVAGEPVD